MPGLPNIQNLRSAGAAVSAVSSAAARVLPALQAAAQRTGVDFGALFNTARLESGFNPQARARTSSATGLFQFVDSTWLNTLARHGARHGINASSRGEALALRNDPAIASLMAAEHMADNAALLESKLGREAAPTDLYLAHFLGAGGAVEFLKGLAANPNASAASAFPAAARANRSIFFASGAPRSLQQVHDLFAARLNGGAPSANPVAANPVLAATAPASSLPALILAGAETGGLPAMQPLQAARLAYLLLADMGG